MLDVFAAPQQETMMSRPRPVFGARQRRPPFGARLRSARSARLRCASPRRAGGA